MCDFESGTCENMKLDRSDCTQLKVSARSGTGDVIFNLHYKCQSCSIIFVVDQIY